MFFLYRGEAHVVSEDHKTIFDTLKAGHFFGEISLVFSCPRTATIKTATDCDLFVLAKTDLDKVLENFDDVSAQIRTEANERFARVKERGKGVGVSSTVPSVDPLPPTTPQNSLTSLSLSNITSQLSVLSAWFVSPFYSIIYIVIFAD